MTSALASFKMASMTGVGSKNIFRLLLIISVIAPLIATMGAIWSFYTFGLQRLPTAASVAGDYVTNRAWPSAILSRPAIAPWMPQLIVGIIWSGVLIYLHARFIWFPFEPIGFLLATDGHLLVEGIWTMVVAAWVMKTLTVRISGSKLYEQTGIPVAAGFIIGFIIITVLGGSLLVIRFFVPF